MFGYIYSLGAWKWMALLSVVNYVHWILKYGNDYLVYYVTLIRLPPNSCETVNVKVRVIVTT